jgi:hypothetical protein
MYVIFRHLRKLSQKPIEYCKSVASVMADADLPPAWTLTHEAAMTREDWISIGKGAGIAVAGAFLTFASTALIPAMQASGSATLLAVAAFASVAINVIRKQVMPKND